MCRGRASNCVFTGQAISVGLPWSQQHWVYFLWLVRLPREGSSDLLSGRQAPGCWCSGSWVEAAIPKTQHTQLLLSCSVHLFQHPLRGHLVFSPPRPPLRPLRTVIFQLPARVGEGLGGSNCFCNRWTASIVFTFTSSSRGAWNRQWSNLLETLIYKSGASPISHC